MENKIQIGIYDDGKRKYQSFEAQLNCSYLHGIVGYGSTQSEAIIDLQIKLQVIEALIQLFPYMVIKSLGTHEEKQLFIDQSPW